MKILGTLAALVLLTGCSALQRGARDPSEWVYQASSAVDFSQTVTVARRPQCYYEANPLTSRLIGKHPSEAGVEGIWAVYSITHLAITGWLDREADATGSRGWYAAKWIWQLGTLGESYYSVHENFAAGLDLFGAPGCGSRQIVPRIK